MLTLRINGQSHQVDVPEDMPLLWVLRDHLSLVGTKYGCGVAQCGACTVHVGGKPVRSCQLSVGDVGTRAVVTIEGIGETPNGAKVQQAWIDAAVPQCGYCQAGQIMSATALLDGNPHPDDADIDAAMAGNLCRCGTYIRIRQAIKNASSQIGVTMRKIAGLVVAIIVVIALGFAGWLYVGRDPMAFASGSTVPLDDHAGANITGVPAELASADPVKRGEYLVHAADCQACHTAPGGAPFAGGFAFNMPFGTIYSTNITPDKETGIGNYTDAQFLAAVHKGIRADGEHLYPAMPYTSYTYMTDTDALAIKAYLFTLAPVHAPARQDQLSFPYNHRGLLAVWNVMFNADERFRPNTGQSPQWNRGAYLAEAMGHCGECHTPRNLAFALDNHSKFAGALTAGWRAYNITSDKDSGIGDWSDQDVYLYLSTGHANGHGGAAGPMGEATDDSLSYLVPDDTHALVTYLRSIPAHASDLPRTVTTPAPASYKEGVPVDANPRGEKLFAGACASCHDWTGVSPVTGYATLTGVRAVNDPSAANVAQTIIHGVDRNTAQGRIFMPAFGDGYSDDDIAAVANYVTARFGAKGARLTGKDVGDLRKQASQQHKDASND